MKILDLFAGVGGLSYSFHKDKDFKVLAMNEILDDPCRTYSLNNPRTEIFNMDIRKFNRNLFDKNIDIVLGGPPCQSFSTSGKRELGDPRASLYRQYARVVEEYSPKVFIFENVAGLLTIDKGRLFEKILNKFKNIGYKIHYEIINAVEFNVPQHRRRIIVIGYKKRNANFQLRKSSKKKTLSLGDALGDMPLEDSTEYACDPQNIFQKKMRKNSQNLRDHQAPKHGAKLVEIMSSLNEGGTLKDIPEKIRPQKAFGNSYSRLWWDKPSYTITRNFGTPSSARCIHPLADRALTTREGARLQSFPDSFRFVGSRVSKNLQIGEAVPPFLSKVIKNLICYNM